VTCPYLCMMTSNSGGVCVANTAVVSGVLGNKSYLDYDNAKQQSARDVQPDQLAYTSGCPVPCGSYATSKSLTDHGRTPARFAFLTRDMLRAMAKTIAELIEALTSVKSPGYTFKLVLPTRLGLSVAS